MEKLGNQLKNILDQHEKAWHGPLNREMPHENLSQELDLKILENPGSEQEFSDFIKKYLHYSVNTQHPFYMNQLWSKTQEASLVGELLAAMTNTSMYTYEVAPVATLLERKMCQHLSQLVWGESTDGIMTSGGTASNLQALLTARNIKFQNSKNQGLVSLDKKPVILAAANSHYSVKRSLNILGLGQDQLIEVEVEQSGSMSPEKLQSAINESIARGEQPFCVVSTAGTTVYGSYDNFKEIGSICKKEDLWFHIDGAYGGSTLFSQKHRKILDGVELADSFSWDFHKILGVHLPCAFLFTKEKGLLKQALSSGNDSYLFHDEDSIDLGPSSLQCGRRNDILKLWLTFLNAGTSGIENRVNKLFDIAFSLSDLVKSDSEFQLVTEPQSINVCFRLKGKEKISFIRDHLRRTGQAMINYSQDSEGEFFRFASTNPELTTQDLSKLLEIIKQAQSLEH